MSVADNEKTLVSVLVPAYNEEKNIRYCIWLAPSEEELKNIFTSLGVRWETIVEVKETVPDLWGEKWQEHLAAEATASTKGN